MSDVNEKIMSDYFENRYEHHMERLRRMDRVEGRMGIANEESDGTVVDTFWRFLHMEMSSAANHYGTLVVYMPHIGVNRKWNRHGKIIFEIVSRLGHEQIEDCFELQLADESNIMEVRMDVLQRQHHEDDEIVRYYNMFVKWEDALPIVQKVLFCEDLFIQRFLMTTASRNLGAITTQRFLSPIGHVLSFRSCVLNE